MSVAALHAEAAVNTTAVRFYGSLELIRSHADSLAGGTSDIGRVIAALRTIDVGHDQAAAQWTALADVRTAQEHTAVGAIKTALDDLLIAFADAMVPLSVPTVVNLGTGYGGTRAQKLAALATAGRAFPFVTFNLPASVTSKAAALVAAIDAFTSTPA